MTPDLRAEAEKVAAELWEGPRSGLTLAQMTDALVAFAQRVGKRERLKGQIEELVFVIEGHDVGNNWWKYANEQLARLGAELAALDKEAG